MKNFNGIFTALLTPYKKDGSVNYEVLKKMVRHYLQNGIQGFYVCGSTAEAYLLSHNERKRILEVVAQENNGEGVIFAHVGAIGTDLSIELAKHAQTCKIDALSSISPFYYGFSTDEIRQYYFDLADSTDLPMIIYNFPKIVGYELTSDILKDYLVNEKIIGVKHTSSNFFQLQQMKQLKPDLMIWNGFDEMLLSGLIAGANGGIGSTYNCMPHLYVELFEKFRQGDIKAAQELQKKANNIIKIICDVGVYQAEKALMEIQGFECNGCRRPFGKISTENYELMKKVYKKIIKIK